MTCRCCQPAVFGHQDRDCPRTVVPPQVAAGPPGTDWMRYNLPPRTEGDT